MSVCNLQQLGASSANLSTNSNVRNWKDTWSA